MNFLGECLVTLGGWVSLVDTISFGIGVAVGVVGLVIAVFVTEPRSYR